MATTNKLMLQLAALAFLLCLGLAPSEVLARGSLYYGYNPLGGTDGGRLYLFGAENDTSVEAWDLTNDLHWGPFTMGRGTLKVVSLQSNSHIKVRSYDHPIYATMGGGSNFLVHENSGTVFFSTIDPASRVGRDFFFYTPVGDVDRTETLYVVTAYSQDGADPVSVAVKDESGNVKTTCTLNVGETCNVTQYIGFHDVTWITSTGGDISVVGTAVDGYDVAPSQNGSDMGTTFFCPVMALSGGGGSVAIFGYEDGTQFQIYDYNQSCYINSSRICSNDIATLDEGDLYYLTGLGVTGGYRNYRITADRDVMVWCGDTQGGTTIRYMGDDIAQQIGKEGLDIFFHTQSHGAEIYAMFDDTSVIVTNLTDDEQSTQTLAADGVISLHANDEINRQYRVQCNKPCLVQTGGGNGYDNYQVLMKPMADMDYDHDTINDQEEGRFAETVPDLDEDGLPDWQDPDSDDDGIPDALEAGDDDPLTPALDTDEDGTPDYLDEDSDDDGISDQDEYAAASGQCQGASVVDCDDDGLYNFQDQDSDSDGKPDQAETATADTDCDSSPDYLDYNDDDGPCGDRDGDGVTSGLRNSASCSGSVLSINCAVPGEECICTCESANVVFCASADNPDSDNDNIMDGYEVGLNVEDPMDSDDDGIPDVLELDSDDDGIPDSVEKGNDILLIPPVDTDRDRLYDFQDPDSDADEIPDSVEAGGDPTDPVDTDSDDIPDYIDVDSDRDGKSDYVEGTEDHDGDGLPNYVDENDEDGPLGDLDQDGLTNREEDLLGSNRNNPDSDADGINDFYEVCRVYTACDPSTASDQDEDGTPDWNDPDSDDDGIPDSVEYHRGDSNQPPTDTDNDGTPDFRDEDSDADDIPDRVEYIYDPALCTHADCASLYPDADNDGTPNYLDYNSDDDSDPDIFELIDDVDEDGIPNWLDNDDVLLCLAGETFPCVGNSVGACDPGTKLCVGNQWSDTCYGEVTAQEEICDNIDNDCDGTTDESASGGVLSIPCGTDVGECVAGRRYCVNGSYAEECSGQVTAAEEICDGLDNDCDNAVDEGCFCVDDETRECGVSDVGQCQYGTQRCVNGSWAACVGAIEPTTEICDNVDNNCDGFVDENLSRECGEDTGVCQFGTQICSQGIWGECSGMVTPTEEVCDNLDNDCDDTIDENVTRTCSANVGICREGLQTCQNGIWGACVGGIEPVDETCDGQDNDCDGTVDEGCDCAPGETRDCGYNQGTCEFGTQTCQAGSWGACENAIEPELETCDNLDNDCDGEVDEGLTQTCGDYDQGVCRHGYSVCQAGDWSECRGNIDPSPEVCDGLDNNCDGQIDENITISCGFDIGECQPGVQTCTSGTFGSCVGAVYPTSEVCDGLDNNCNGETDEFLTRACGTNEGECRAGVQSCLGGEWAACEGATGATAEVCDGLDNDCDGQIDNVEGGCECFEDGAVRACGTNVGECIAGVQTCLSGQWGACEGNTRPTLEVCDGLDNDCDGQLDEGITIACGTSVGQCSQGVSECEDGSFGVCRDDIGPAEELCDGLDNNCDGQIDEGLTRVCGSNEGICITGIQTCYHGEWGSCVGETQATLETCDGLDNNCDGQIDEGCECVNGTLQVCGSTVGDCEQGIQECVGGAWGVCQGAVNPVDEACDGRDNDCDGRVDEELTVPCGSNLGACSAGIQQCVNGTYTECLDMIGPTEETCDGEDNDCDGLIDENLNRVCGTDTGVCRTGLQLCTLGDWGDCQDSISGTDAETCGDGLDNTCDGQIDEGCFCEEGTMQSCGQGDGLCEPGTQTCQGGQWGPCADEIGPEQEACDGFDNDCDGRVDENLFQRCGTDVGECVSGLIWCSNGEWGECQGAIGPQEEVCDGLDNNCDGQIDEDVFVACGTDVGECQAGIAQCVAGQPAQCVGEIPPSPELCDGLDNDCDGFIDNDLPGCGQDLDGDVDSDEEDEIDGDEEEAEDETDDDDDVTDDDDDDTTDDDDDDTDLIDPDDHGEFEDGDWVIEDGDGGNLDDGLASGSDSGCGCHTQAKDGKGFQTWLGLLVFGGFLAGLRRRRKR